MMGELSVINKLVDEMSAMANTSLVVVKLLREDKITQTSTVGDLIEVLTKEIDELYQKSKQLIN
jgi:23S rRNA A1618 N6-methylase RlmF